MADAGTRLVAPAMVGRHAELELLATTVAAAPAVVTVEGEAGIGKTRLVTALADRPEVAGRRLLTARCREIRERFPLGPVIQAVRSAGDALRGARLSPVVGALRPELPELSALLPPSPVPLDDPVAERHRVFRGLVDLLAALGPTVLVLEDLHWADARTNEFLTYLMGGPPPDLSLVMTFRGECLDPGVRAPTIALPASVARAHIMLGPLGPEATGELAAAILRTDRVSREFAAYLCERASGVPYVIEELLALLRDRGSLVRRDGTWARKAIDELDIPSSIREAVLKLVDRLSEDGRRVVEAASVLQEPVPYQVLFEVSRVAKDRVRQATEEALASGLLTERGQKIGFRRLLAAQAVYEEIPAFHQQTLHGWAAAALQAHDPTALGQVAHHLRRADRMEEWVTVAERAAARAVELGHEAEAVRLYEDLLYQAPLDSAKRGQVAVNLGRAAVGTIRPTEELVRALSEVLDQETALPREMRGELALWLALTAEAAGVALTCRHQLLLDAVTNLGEGHPLGVWAMAALGMPTCPGFEAWDSFRWLDRAVEALPSVEDTDFSAFLTGKVSGALVTLGDPRWSALAARIEQHTGGAPSNRLAVRAHFSAGLAVAAAGHHAAAKRLLTPALSGAVACESRSLQELSRAALALLDCFTGRWEGLGERLEVLLDEVAEADPAALVCADLAAGYLALAHGEPDRARRLLSEAAQEAEARGWVDFATVALHPLARLAVAENDLREVTAGVDRLLTTLESRCQWVGVTRVLPDAARVLVAAGRRDDVGALVTRCSESLETLDAPLAPAALGYARGFLDAADQAHPSAARQFVNAAELYESLDCPYDAAQAREQAAWARFAAGEESAEATLRATLTVYRRLGASWDEARCARIARDYGVRLPMPYRGGRRMYGERLSPREEEVANLAARGLRDKEIAGQLYLSPRTVRNHLDRAMRKLGVRSRAALAARLSERRQ